MFEDPIIAFSLLQMRNQVSLYLTIMLITFFFRIILKLHVANTRQSTELMIILALKKWNMVIIWGIKKHKPNINLFVIIVHFLYTAKKITFYNSFLIVSMSQVDTTFYEFSVSTSPTLYYLYCNTLLTSLL